MTTYLTEISLRHEVLKKLNAAYIFTLKGLDSARSDGRLDTLLTPEERQHVAEKVAAWVAK